MGNLMIEHKRVSPDYWPRLIIHVIPLDYSLTPYHTMDNLNKPEINEGYSIKSLSWREMNAVKHPDS